MLTADLIKPFLRIHGRRLTVDQVNETHAYWQQTAQDLIQLFHLHLGQSRAQWEEALERYEGDRVDYIRLRGLAKVLAGAATFSARTFAFDPSDLRERLFHNGPVFALPDLFHPATRQDLFQEVASEFQLSPEELEKALFADHPGNHILTSLGPAWTPQGLLQRYNLELARGALYQATIVQIEIYDHYKETWRYLKLFKLMYSAKELTGGGYQVRLSGPLSDFVETKRYGVAFAEFFPALLLGERWNLVAKVKPYPLRQASEQPMTVLPQEDGLLYQLDQTCGLQSHYRKGREYDSALERIFASEFNDFEEKFGETRGKWRLIREDQVLIFDGSVMIPDFLLVHTQDEHRRILIELVGFWSPRYLKNKIAKVQAAQCPHLLLLVYESLNVTKEDFGVTPTTILFFKEKPVLKEVMATVETLAEKLYGPPPLLQKKRPLSLSEILDRCAQFRQSEALEWYSLEELGSLLLQSDEAFTPRQYGYASLSSLVKGHPAFFEVRRGNGKGRPLEVRFTSEIRSLPLQQSS